MNEVLLHRGREPHLTKIDCFVNNQLLTSVYVRHEIISNHFSHLYIFFLFPIPFL
jgi:NADH kinase